MRYFPICLDLKARPVLAVGGGPIAEGKILQLVEAAAHVHVVSLTITEKLQQAVAAGVITFRQGEFCDSDLADNVLVICATNNPAVNEFARQPVEQVRMRGQFALRAELVAGFHQADAEV